MKKKYVFAGLISFAFILGWNVFLIQRDNRMYDAYYGQKTTQQVK